MIVKTIIAWIDGAVKPVEVDVREYVATEPTIEDRIAALEQVNTVKSVTLYASNWVGDASPYSQAVGIEGATQYSKIDLQPSTEQLTIFHQKDLAFVAENEDGEITIFCVGQKPTADYTIQVTVTEVFVNE